MLAAEVKDTVTFGVYEQDGDTGNGAEPIEWTVLDRVDDKLYLISKYSIEWMPFDEAGSYHWADSSLRKWLGGEFYESAFVQTERDAIVSVAGLDNSNDHDGGTRNYYDGFRYWWIIDGERVEVTEYYTGKNPDDYWARGVDAVETEDKIFLLGMQEIPGFMAPPPGGADAYGTGERVAQPTAYAQSKGATFVNGTQNCFWWTRNMGIDTGFVPFVDEHGHTKHMGQKSVSCSGVRPVMWVDLNLLQGKTE